MSPTRQIKSKEGNVTVIKLGTEGPKTGVVPFFSAKDNVYRNVYKSNSDWGADAYICRDKQIDFDFVYTFGT